MRPLIRMRAYDYDCSAAHGAQWQELELILRRLLQHGNIRARRKGSIGCASLRPAETLMRACMRPSEAACFRVRKCTNNHQLNCGRCSNVFTTRMRSLLPYCINTQNAVCAAYITIYKQTLIGEFFVHGNGYALACLTRGWNLFYLDAIFKRS